MAERKRNKIPYSQLPNDEKRTLNEKRKIKAAGQGKTSSRLISVPVQESYSIGNNEATDGPSTTSKSGDSANMSSKIQSSGPEEEYSDIRDDLCMASNQLEFSELTLGTKHYKTSGMVIEKGLPRLLGKTKTLYQRIVLQNIKGEKIQSIIYGSNINILEKTLKLYHCYTITNAPLGTISESFRYLEIPYQMTLSAKTPIEEIQIDGLTMRSLKYNFTQLADLDNITETGPTLDVLFAILEVSSKRKPKNSYVTDVKAIDQSLRPTTISLWDQFSEIEANAMANLPGTFPIAIGLHLRIASYYGTGLGTHNSSIFILNPPIPQATTLQAWCLENAEKIKALPLSTGSKMQMINTTPPKPEEIVKIINLPTSVNKPEMRSVEGLIRVTDLKQSFYYLTCSVCNRSTNAFGDSQFWCNYCEEKVAALPKLKFKVQITDLTGSIEAIVFAEAAKQYYEITGADIDANAMDGSLPMHLLHKLSQPKDCSIHLKAEMNDYGGINQCRFIVQSIFDSPAQESTAAKQPLQLAPTTPNKKSKIEKYGTEQSHISSEPKKGQDTTAMDTESDQIQKNKSD